MTTLWWWVLGVVGYFMAGAVTTLALVWFDPDDIDEYKGLTVAVFLAWPLFFGLAVPIWFFVEGPGRRGVRICGRAPWGLVRWVAAASPHGTKKTS